MFILSLEVIKDNARRSEAGEGLLDMAPPEVLRELTNENPAIVRAATLALIAMLGPAGAIKKLVAVVEKSPGDVVDMMATALRFTTMGVLARKDDIVAELEGLMQAGDEAQRTAARRLMQEFGGSLAMTKVGLREVEVAVLGRIKDCLTDA